MNWLAWLLDLEDVQRISGVSASFAASWAEGRGFWIALACCVLVAAALLVYTRLQTRGSARSRGLLGVLRGGLLCLLLLTLANPILHLTLTEIRRPRVYLVFDGTESMAIRDDWTDEQRRQFEQDAQLSLPSDGRSPTRQDLVRSLLTRPANNLLQRLTKEKGADVEAYLFDDRDSGQLRRLKLSADDRPPKDGNHLASQLSTRGRVTALGSVLLDIGRQTASKDLAGVILVSDFAHNTGVAPLGGDASAPVQQVGTPIYTLGVGAARARDLAVALQTEPKMKRAEKTTIEVKVQQRGLTSAEVVVELTARRQVEAGAQPNPTLRIGTRRIKLTGPVEVAQFPFTPKDAGPFQFVASVAPVPGEALKENNRATREVNIIDDFLRLLYVAYEPTWEWRFVKEVFHRDKLVGMEGFRTFLSSSDPRVRQNNILFTPTLTPARRDFFVNDVLFLGDMPADSLQPMFCEMVKEFVSVMGGGLVVIAGPRFGPQALRDTPLADMLPVLIDPDAGLRDDREFRLQLTPHAARHPFMQLDDTPKANAEAWQNMGKLPWYQPVAALHEQAVALAVHPRDKCRDGKTPQPLIAIRQYGKGEVVYIGFNEMFRLRRLYGARYYRRFWSQLIYRLGMSHALGADKRFTLRLDRSRYRSGDRAVLTVEAYDENYDRLTEDRVAGKALAVTLTRPPVQGAAPTEKTTATMLRSGVFETRIPVFTPGQYTVKVTDPITQQDHERRFEVTELSIERRRATRDVGLQQEIARQTAGGSYELAEADRLIDEMPWEEKAETQTRNHPLWSTPLWFLLVVGLMLTEWIWRKRIHLA